MNDKKKYLAIITGFSSLDGYLHIHDLFIEKLSKNFEKIFIINHQNLKFFPRIARSVYYEKEKNEFLEEVSKLPKNFELFDPKDSKDFSKFLENKKILVINNFGRHFFALKIYLLLKKYKIQQIQIRNTGHIPSDQYAARYRYQYFETNEDPFQVQHVDI